MRKKTKKGKGIIEVTRGEKKETKTEGKQAGIATDEQEKWWLTEPVVVQHGRSFYFFGSYFRRRAGSARFLALPFPN